MIEKFSELKPVPVLTECCGRSVACRLHSLRSGEVTNARFQGISPGQLEVRLESDQKGESFQAESLCCVAFHYQQFLCGFMVCVRHVRSTGSVVDVLLEVPTALAAKNMRQSFRVPVISDSGVELAIRLRDGTRINSEAVNISDTGIEAKLPTDDNRLVVDSEVVFELQFRDDRLELPGIVRRREQSRRGFQFMHSNTVESRATVASLQRVVRTLEQMWLKSRLA